MDKVRNLQASERAYATAQENAAEALAQWLAVERAGVRTLSGKIFDEAVSVVHNPFEHATQSEGSLATLLKAKVRAATPCLHLLCTDHANLLDGLYIITPIKLPFAYHFFFFFNL